MHQVRRGVAAGGDISAAGEGGVACEFFGERGGVGECCDVAQDGSRVGAASVHFAPGEKRTVVLPLPVSSLAYWDESRHTWVVERDPVRIQVGASSADIRGQADINVVP